MFAKWYFGCKVNITDQNMKIYFSVIAIHLSNMLQAYWNGGNAIITVILILKYCWELVIVIVTDNTKQTLERRLQGLCQSTENASTVTIELLFSYFQVSCT